MTDREGLGQPDGYNAGRCDPEIFERGETIAAVSGRPWPVERWVRAVAEKANARLDWHYSGGVANVLHLGDAESRSRAGEAIIELAASLEGHILRLYAAGEPGLYRSGVTEIPGHAIGVHWNPFTGEQEAL